MKSNVRPALLFAAALCLAASANADQFGLTYTFGGGNSVIGAGSTVTCAFGGTLNGNLITNISGVTLIVAGGNPNVAPFTYDSALAGDTVYAYADGGSNPAVISVDGTQNNFDFDDAIGGFGFYSLTGSAASTFDGGYAFLELDGPPRQQTLIAYDESQGGDPLNSSWSVVQIEPVPTPTPRPIPTPRPRPTPSVTPTPAPTRAPTPTPRPLPTRA
jgi:hypothetical protein